MGAAERVRIQEVDAFGAARVQFSGMEKRLSSPEMMNATHGQLEEYVIEQGRELERLLLQAHMDLRAAREERVEVRGADGVRRTMTRASMRPVMTLVGEVDVERLAYQAREVPGLHPMDAALNLPREQYSHGVRRFVAENAALLSFDDVRHLLLKRTGARVPKRQLEELAVRSAVDFDAFYVERRAGEGMAEPGRHRDLLVMSFDGKGIVMVPEGLRPATQKAAKKAVRKLSTRLTAGEKRNRKRMAQVAAIYTVGRYGREPEDVLADLNGTGGRTRPERPKVTNKRVWASVEHEPETVIEEAFREAQARDPKHRRQWVVLVDGNKDQLAIINAKREELGAVRIVVDLIHVLEYLWRAAHALLGDGTKPAEAWVQEQLLALLRDRPAAEIAVAMRGAARKKKLQRGALKAVVEAADYLETYAEYMGYGQALAMGLPIATGVIEGACRYLVKDRMDRGGARWTLKGAEAVLRLRALRTSGDFDAYWDYHLCEERRRHHAERYANTEIPNPIPPARTLRRVK